MTEIEKEIDLVTEVRDNCYTQAEDYGDPLLFEKAHILDGAVDRLNKCRWIPCSERMPEDGGRYLVTRGSGLDAYTTLCNWYKGVWTVDFIMPADVVAWMPLPEPWKEGKHEEEKDAED